MMVDLPDSPPLLYKYMPPGYSTEKLLPYLGNGYLRFTQPSALNDPFEMEGVYPQSDLSAATDKYIKLRFNALKDRANFTKNDRQALGYWHAVSKEAKRRVLVDPKSSDAEIWRLLRSRQDETYGILSLSETWSNSAMWSHYSTRHTGICVGFDIAAPLFQLRLNIGVRPVQRVEYVSHRLPVDCANGDKIPPDLFYRKSKDWSYEREWRSVARFPSMPPFSYRKEGYANEFPIMLIHLDHSYVREIYMGAFASRELAEVVTGFAARHSVRVYRARLADTTYEMDRTEIV